MPLPPAPPVDSWWAHHSKPSQRVYVYTTAIQWDDDTKQVVVYADEIPGTDGTPVLATARFIDLKLWYNRFDYIDPDAPVEMSVDLNQAGTNAYTPEQLEKMRAILKGAEGG